MCGIYGKVRFDGRDASAADAARACGALRHRGPDDSGVHAAGPACLDVHSDADHHRFGNAGAGMQHGFDFLRRDLLAARLDDVVLAPDEVQEAFIV